MKRAILFLLVVSLMLLSIPGFTAMARDEAAEPIVLDVFLNHTWYPTDKFEGVIPELITEKTGVVLNPTRAVDETQLGMMIASDELPDLVFTDQELPRLSNAALSYDYGSLIEQYCPEWVPDPILIANATTNSTDGKYYFLYSHAYTAEEYEKATSGMVMSASLLYRGDIASKLGFTPDKLNTMEDLDALYAAVHETYPEMEVFTWGEVMRFGYFDILWGITGNTNWLMEDGKYVHSLGSKAYYDVRKKLNEYFRLGYINPDCFAYDEGTSDGMIYSGGSFSYSNVTQGAAMTFTAQGKAYDPECQILEMKPLRDEAAYRQVHLGWCGTIISRNCKDPEAAIKLMRYLFSEEGARATMWGREGIEYVLNDQGIPVFSEEWKEAEKDENVFASKYNPWFYFGTTGMTEIIVRTANMGQEYQDTYTEMRKKIVCEPWYGLAEPKDPNSDAFLQTEKLVELRDTFDARLVTAESEEAFEQVYAEMIDAAKTIGLDALTEYMNGEISRYRELY